MIMTNLERLALLRAAVQVLDTADSLVQSAYVDTTDSTAIECYDIHCSIEDVISTLEERIDDLEAEVTNG